MTLVAAAVARAKRLRQRIQCGNHRNYALTGSALVDWVTFGQTREPDWEQMGEFMVGTIHLRCRRCGYIRHESCGMST